MFIMVTKNVTLFCFIFFLRVFLIILFAETIHEQKIADMNKHTNSDRQKKKKRNTKNRFKSEKEYFCQCKNRVKFITGILLHLLIS